MYIHIFPPSRPFLHWQMRKTNILRKTAKEKYLKTKGKI